MFANQIRKRISHSFIQRRLFRSSEQRNKEYENPFWRTLRILRNDFSPPSPTIAFNETEKQRALLGMIPNHADVVIIGGGAIGSSIAYWLKEKTSREGIRVVVIEKDMTYSKSTTMLCSGGLHQQFSLPENIQMSIFGAEFIRTLKKRFGSQADVYFNPHGYLVLGNEEEAPRIIDAMNIQREFGVCSQILTKTQLESRFPWMNVSDVEVGCLGLECEGWFDPWALFTLLRYGAQDLGTQYLPGEVVDFTFKEREDYVVDGVEEGSYESIREIVIKMPDGQHKSMEFAYCIIAAGADSTDLAQLGKIGAGSGMLSIPLPIRRGNRYMYGFQCLETPPGINAPMTLDNSGVYFRRDGLGGSFIAGFSPIQESGNADKYFQEIIAPALKNRVHSFGSVQLKNSWCGSYEYNYFDDSGIIGPHPYYHNLYLATGFSGNGIQQAPAVGRGIAELILDGGFKTIDLTRFGFDRFIVDKPMFELAVQ